MLKECQCDLQQGWTRDCPVYYQRRVITKETEWFENLETLITRLFRENICIPTHLENREAVTRGGTHEIEPVSGRSLKA
jgi:hypothetical protein